MFARLPLCLPTICQFVHPSFLDFIVVLLSPTPVVTSKSYGWWVCAHTKRFRHLSSSAGWLVGLNNTPFRSPAFPKRAECAPLLSTAVTSSINDNPRTANHVRLLTSEPDDCPVSRARPGAERCHGKDKHDARRRHVPGKSPDIDDRTDCHVVTGYWWQLRAALPVHRVQRQGLGWGSSNDRSQITKRCFRC